MSITEQIAAAQPRDVIVYWRGHLLEDILLWARGNSQRAKDARRQAWAAYEAGLCDLVQKRIPGDRFEYRAIRRRS